MFLLRGRRKSWGARLASSIRRYREQCDSLSIPAPFFLSLDSPTRSVNQPKRLFRYFFEGKRYSFLISRDLFPKGTLFFFREERFVETSSRESWNVCSALPFSSFFFCFHFFMYKDSRKRERRNGMELCYICCGNER